MKIKGYGITKVIPLNPDGNMNVSTEFNVNLPNICQDISLWTNTHCALVSIAWLKISLYAYRLVFGSDYDE